LSTEIEGGLFLGSKQKSSERRKLQSGEDLEKVGNGIDFGEEL